MIYHSNKKRNIKRVPHNPTSSRSVLRIPFPDSYPSRIPDPGSKNSNKREGWNKISCHAFFCSHKFHKIVNYFIFGMLKKKIWANFQRMIELFNQKIVTKLSKIWVWDPGSGFRDPVKTFSGSRIRIRNTAHVIYKTTRTNKDNYYASYLSSLSKYLLSKHPLITLPHKAFPPGDFYPH
jgi:hypothetical protein